MYCGPEDKRASRQLIERNSTYDYIRSQYYADRVRNTVPGGGAEIVTSPSSHERPKWN